MVVVEPKETVVVDERLMAGPELIVLFLCLRDDGRQLSIKIPKGAI